MRPRERRYLDRMRVQTKAILGGQCALRGPDCSGPLEIDHPGGRWWEPSSVGIVARWRRYLDEARAGLVRLLCRAHNRGYAAQSLRALASKW